MEIAERRAMTSGFSLSDIGIGADSGAKPGKPSEHPSKKYSVPGGTIVVEPGTGARSANTGVTGEYGGRGGVPAC